ncbi:ATP synthase F1, epsilon subunit [Parvibaculum lavamentivorans DS-1]|uniref:ATP synthase epsilon chain n=1 Tax=Parvibaculum lavamentivorans (strain DS-1 / DSM 13023 / NCIMB 13966) TaxID=402881 RepID=ATPE_PARL1|nr:F0F1 ATP synthase subunit epsilon [Parvibaculum lavamentivorans]A7HT53.1 RecName: Full=ATP synthase epsilon chain; AltName: Full=ATP synthase F1 sector epsilon subunit; AltName: Full=F-ATPase epsilon subunit [Parvibaculum lavamentivorans DS-1]ABS63086.1 ATP synthase F1, epsilon subunit [Parvibaculum lavamentivorans DS-1]
MAEKLNFDLVSPERLLFSGQVDMVVIPGSEGDMGIMAGHAPVMSTLRPGIIEVENEGAPRQRIFVRGGFAEVTPAGLTVLAEFTVPLADLDATALDREIALADKDVADAKNDDKRQSALEKLDHLKELRHTV